MISKSPLLILIFIFIVGLILGFCIGVGTTIKAVADIASKFIDIDYQMVHQAIFQYKNHIGACYNASVFP